MGRIHSYPFQWVVFIPLSGPPDSEFNDDTLVIVVPDDSEYAGTTIEYSEFTKLEWEDIHPEESRE